MGEGSYYEVDADELRARGNGMLRAGDAVHAAAARGALLGHSGYGGAQLGPAGGGFADRYTYLLRQVGDEAVTEGYRMRGSAFAYEESDAIIADSFDDTGGGLE